MPLKCFLKFKLQNGYLTNGMGVFVPVVEDITFDE